MTPVGPACARHRMCRLIYSLRPLHVTRELRSRNRQRLCGSRRTGEFVQGYVKPGPAVTSIQTRNSRSSLHYHVGNRPPFPAAAVTTPPSSPRVPASRALCLGSRSRLPRACGLGSVPASGLHGFPLVTSFQQSRIAGTPINTVAQRSS